MKKLQVLFIEPCDFIANPPGGQLSFAKNLITVTNQNYFLAGISDNQSHLGHWREKILDNKKFPYFSFQQNKLNRTKSFIPRRLSAFLGIMRHKEKIFTKQFDLIFTQAPEVLLAIGPKNLKKTIYMFPGVENPLSGSRYWYAKYFAKIYEIIIYMLLEHVLVILACADDDSIDKLKNNIKKDSITKKIAKFPTRFNHNVFHKIDQKSCREKLEIDEKCILFVSVGRINKIKGWQLLLDSFRLFIRDHRNSKLIFVGDGEDKDILLKKAMEYDINNCVIVTGFVDESLVAKHINSADVCLVGSYREGWSIAMLEILGCGKPIVSTCVSGAKDLILEGHNGFIINDRDPYKFSKKMEDALHLTISNMDTEETIIQYSINTLGIDFDKICTSVFENIAHSNTKL